MSIISDITTTLSSLNLPIAVGLYKPSSPDAYPDAYIVITPLDERNEDIADDAELTETEAADVNLYNRGNYQSNKNQIKSRLKLAGFYFADCRYIAYETETDHHHYVFTVEKKEVL